MVNSGIIGHDFRLGQLLVCSGELGVWLYFQLFLKAGVDLSALTDIIVSQGQQLGSTVKVSGCGQESAVLVFSVGCA